MKQTTLQSQKNKLWFRILFLFFSILHLLLPTLNHYFYRTYTYDYGVYNFAFYDYAHLQINPCPVYHNLHTVTFLQDHFSLSLMILSPLYWLLTPFAGTYSLLIIQWLCIVFGAFCTFQYVECKFRNYKLGLFAMVYYFLIFNRFSAYQSDCNLAIIGAALLPAFFYFFETKKTVPLVLVFSFLLFCREDFPLTLIFMCSFLMIINWKQKARLKFASLLLLISVSVLLTTFAYLIPLVENSEKRFSLFNYSILGETPSQAALFIIKYPVKALSYLFVNHREDSAWDGIKASF